MELSAVYDQFARIGKALSNPVRLHLLVLLDQGERGVEELAEAAGMRLQNTSAQLQHLRAAQLVANRRDGNRIYYRLAGPEVSEFLGHFQRFGEAALDGLRSIAEAEFGDVSELDPVSVEELEARLADPETVILDVRPAVEFAAGHIPGALSVPLAELAGRLDEIPRNAAIFAYCRGRYCVMAPTATRLLREHGKHARPLSVGMSGWRWSGREVETSLVA